MQASNSRIKSSKTNRSRQRHSYAWLGASALTLGVGAVLAGGSALAHADTGDGQSASPSPGRSRAAAAEQPARTARPNVTATARTARPAAAATSRLLTTNTSRRTITPTALLAATGTDSAPRPTASATAGSATWTPGSIIAVFFSDGTAEHPNAGLLVGNGYSFDGSSCTGTTTCNGGNGGALLGSGGNGYNGGSGGQAGLIAGQAGNGGAAATACTTDCNGGAGGSAGLLGVGGNGGAGVGTGTGGTGGRGGWLYGFGGNGGLGGSSGGTGGTGGAARLFGGGGAGGNGGGAGAGGVGGLGGLLLGAGGNGGNGGTATTPGETGGNGGVGGGVGLLSVFSSGGNGGNGGNGAGGIAGNPGTDGGAGGAGGSGGAGSWIGGRGGNGGNGGNGGDGAPVGGAGGLGGPGGSPGRGGAAGLAGQAGFSTASISYVVTPTVPGASGGSLAVNGWQGLTTAGAQGQYLISGTTANPNGSSGSAGLLYAGPLTGQNGLGYVMVMPDQPGQTTASTTTYSADNLGSGQLRAVGTYSNTGAANELGWVFTGTVNDVGNPNSYVSLPFPTLTATWNVPHSTSGGLVVGDYDSSTFQDKPAGAGRAYVYDAVNQRYLVPSMVYPGSAGNTAYGIWWNGGTSYTICGGYSNLPVNNLLNPRVPLSTALLVDFDSSTGQFSNWTSYSYTDPGTGYSGITHFEGISGVQSGKYTLSAVALVNGVTTAGFVTAERLPDGSFGNFNWTTLNPGVVGGTTFADSVYGNAVVGIAPNSSGVNAYQAFVSPSAT